MFHLNKSRLIHYFLFHSFRWLSTFIHPIIIVIRNDLLIPIVLMFRLRWKTRWSINWRSIVHKRWGLETWGACLLLFILLVEWVVIVRGFWFFLDDGPLEFWGFSLMILIRLRVLLMLRMAWLVWFSFYRALCGFVNFLLFYCLLNYVSNSTLVILIISFILLNTLDKFLNPTFLQLLLNHLYNWFFSLDMTFLSRRWYLILNQKAFNNLSQLSRRNIVLNLQGVFFLRNS